MHAVSSELLQLTEATQAVNWTAVIVSHPHTDHIADIENITANLSPSIISRREDLDWSRVSDGEPSAQLTHLRENYCHPNYSGTIAAGDYPVWGDGMTLNSYMLPVLAADQVSASDNSYVNNTSIVTIIKYRGYTFAILGDIETEGMAAFLEAKSALRAEIASALNPLGCRTGGVDFLVTAHHGHPSGFSTEWFEVTGPTRKFNIVSERRLAQGEEESRAAVDARYSSADFSLAGNRAERRMVSTRHDGTIYINIKDQGQWTWEAS